jgi:hypothetical protein
MEFSQIKGVSEYERREVGVNITAGVVNAIEIGQKILSVAPMDTLLNGYLKQKNKA